MSSGESNVDDSPGCEKVLPDDELEELSTRPVLEQVELFSTLGNETRYRILLLLDAADDPVCGCDLEPHLDVGQSSVSQSLSQLRRAGLVSRTKEGRWRYYEPTTRGERLVAIAEGKNVHESRAEATI